MVRPLVLAVSVLVGCGGGVDLDPGTNLPTTDCTGAEAFVAGMTATSTLGHAVALIEASPAPPDVGDNAWTVEVTDADGPAIGLSVELVPWMPLHGHGLSPPAYAGTDEGDGRYTLAPFDLIMPGLWEFTVDLDPGGDVPNTALFALCAEG